MGDEFGEAKTLLALANAWTLLGDFDRGRECCQEVLAISEARNERWFAGWALWAQGLTAWFQQDIQQAKELQKRSIRLREPFQDLLIALSLDQLAWVASAEKQHRHAARLLGVLKTMWHSIGGSLPQALAGEHDRCETETREALGTRAFETAFGEGERLPLDRAIAYALGENTDAAKASATTDPVATQLTRRETEIAQLIAEGLSNKEIAARLVIAQRTAEGHVEHILAKLGFNSRSQVAAWVAETRSAGMGKDGSGPT
jgi:non-specific serine/threonine protein kinase